MVDHYFSLYKCVPNVWGNPAVQHHTDGINIKTIITHKQPQSTLIVIPHEESKIIESIKKSFKKTDD